MKDYTITCTNCGKSDHVGINDNVLIWGQPKHIISGRKRLDGNWGWQCLCGNNSLLTKQESRTITNLQSPDPKEIEQVIKTLVIEKDTRFDMAMSS